MQNIRIPAEWEPQAAILLTWPHHNTDWAENIEITESVYIALTNTIRRFETVLIIANSKSHQRHIHSLLGSLLESDPIAQGLYPVYYCCCPSNDTWARDYGPISVFHDQMLMLLDFKFNGWGGKFDATLDTKINQQLFQQRLQPNSIQSLPALKDASFQVQSLDYVLEGGAIDTNGSGTMLATRRCLLSEARNPNFSLIENEHFLKQTLGVERILWLNHGTLEGDDTDSHIDTLARFISPSHIVYQACDNPNDTHYIELSLMANELKELQCEDGSAYQLTPLPLPSACFNKKGDRLPATYVNFLMINDAVLIPLYDVPEDELALEIFSELFSLTPEGTSPAHQQRTVIGINCRPLIEQFGSLHCITMNIMKPNSTIKES